jgi:hypothetical protein
MRPFLADNDIVYHKLEVVSATPRRKSKTKYVGRAHRGRLLRYLIADGNPFATSASMVRRSLLLDNGGMWEAPRGDAIDDFDLWLRLASDARLRVRFVDRRLGFYEVSGVNISASSRQKYIRYRRLFRRQLAILPGMYRTLANSHFEYILGRYALKLGMDDRAILHLRRVRLDVSPGKFLSAWMRIAIVRIGTLINCHRIE